MPVQYKQFVDADYNSPNNAHTVEGAATRWKNYVDDPDHYFLQSTVNGSYTVYKQEGLNGTPASDLAISLTRKQYSTVGSLTNFDNGRGILKMGSDILDSGQEIYVFVTGYNTGTTHDQLYFNYTVDGVWQTPVTSETPTGPYMAIDMVFDQTDQEVYLVALTNENDLIILDSTLTVQKTYSSGTNKCYRVGLLDEDIGVYNGDLVVAVSTPSDYSAEDTLQWVVWENCNPSNSFASVGEIDFTGDTGIPEYDGYNIIVELDYYWLILDVNKFRVTEDLTISSSTITKNINTVTAGEGLCFYYPIASSGRGDLRLTPTFLAHRESSTVVSIYMIQGNAGKKVMKVQEITVVSTDFIYGASESWAADGITEKFFYYGGTDGGLVWDISTDINGEYLEIDDVVVGQRYLYAPYVTFSAWNKEPLEDGLFIGLTDPYIDSLSFNDINVSDVNVYHLAYFWGVVSVQEENTFPRKYLLKSLGEIDLNYEFEESFTTKTLSEMVTTIVETYCNWLKIGNLDFGSTTYTLELKMNIQKFFQWVSEESGLPLIITPSGEIYFEELEFQGELCDDGDWKKNEGILGNRGFWKSCYGGEINDWDTASGSAYPGIAQILPLDVGEHCYVLLWDKQLSWGRYTFRETLVTGEISFYMRRNINLGTSACSVQFCDTSGNVAIHIILENAAFPCKIQYYDGITLTDSGVTHVSYGSPWADFGVWDYYRIIVNDVDDWDLYINDNLIAEGIAFKDSGMSGIDNLYLPAAAGNTTLMLDAIGISVQGYLSYHNYSPSMEGLGGHIIDVDIKSLKTEIGRITVKGGLINGVRLEGVAEIDDFVNSGKNAVVIHRHHIRDQTTLDNLANTLLVNKNKPFLQVTATIGFNRFIPPGYQTYMRYLPANSTDYGGFDLTLFFVESCKFLPEQKKYEVVLMNYHFFPEDSGEDLAEQNNQDIEENAVNIETNAGDISTAQGDISTAQGDISTAQGDISNIETDIGTLSSLTTTEQGSLVGAINEVDGHADTNAGNISTNTSDITAIESNTDITDIPDQDGEYKGIVVTRTAGENLVFGDACFVATDGEMEKTDANATTTMPCQAICLETITSGNSGKFLLWGLIYHTDWDFSSKIGRPVFVDITTAGNLEQEGDITWGSGDQIQSVGTAWGQYLLLFNPSNTIAEYGT